MLGGALGFLQIIGSLFLTKDNQTSKVVINVAPIVGIVMLSNIVGCSLQDAEPFSQCVEVTFRSIVEGFGL